MEETRRRVAPDGSSLQKPRGGSTIYGSIEVRGARENNLRGVSLDIPKRKLTVFIGVSGSGKSSLVFATVAAESQRLINETYTTFIQSFMPSLGRPDVDSLNNMSAAIIVDQDRMGANARSTVGTATDAYSIMLAFMVGVASVCEACDGKRFTEEVLTYQLRGKNISDVLAMSVGEAREFFTERSVRPMLDGLTSVGLGYLSLGQPLNTLSGGERQRLKLAIQMQTSTEVYVLDEPTTGLHMNDVDNLIKLLDDLVDRGRTVNVIEHNLDVVARADRVIDLGPGAGHDGGRVIFEDTPLAPFSTPSTP